MSLFIGKCIWETDRVSLSLRQMISGVGRLIEELIVLRLIRKIVHEVGGGSSRKHL